MFNKNSRTVKTWVTLVMNGIFKKEQVPRLFNLREVVYSIIEQLISE